VLARTHQNLIWTRQRQVNQLRSALREFFPAALVAFGTDLAHHDALAVLTKAPTPDMARRLSISQIRAALRRGGRQLKLDRRAHQIQTALLTDQLAAPDLIVDAFATTTAALVPIISTLNDQIGQVEARLVHRLDQHPDAELILSLPGLGHVLGARVLAEFGDAPNRYKDAKARRNYAGTSPITIASGTSRCSYWRSRPQWGPSSGWGPSHVPWIPVGLRVPPRVSTPAAAGGLVVFPRVSMAVRDAPTVTTTSRP